eukprot:CAMPEP_0195049598 /NCGR_PEP_ID=MMETSP0347-20130606/58693_1 /TAXON_ID=2932 /ORGANISM="Alexandrium fundyense, Strain CCMP1719" /LENGTH=58 /DNA_ID=CAMNT_0040078363 /DNA_START=7 /DNA_END=181 /DNA_ORIENTATION=+
MTVKVTGRQWYWVYEVESPTDDGDEDDEEEPPGAVGQQHGSDAASLPAERCRVSHGPQ